MSFFNLQEIDYHHHHHDHLQIRTDEHNNNRMDSGGSTVIRSYDCVFCQRGFTTAQALGGHMNIHRKDRVNPTPNNTTNKPNNNNNNNININTSSPNNNEDDDRVDMANTRLFYASKDQLPLGGSSGFEGRVNRFLGSSEKLGDGHMVGKRIQDHSMEGEELDLELRLGHYSW